MFEQKKFERGKLIRQLFLSVCISILSMVLIFLAISWRGVSVDLSTLNPYWLAVGIAIVGGSWLVDGTRLWLSTRVWKKRITFRDAMSTVFSGYFMAAITPFFSGGSPAQMYVLTRSGLSWGEAGSLMVITGVLYQLSLLVMLFLLIFVFRIGFALQGFLLDLLYSFAIVYSVLISLLFFLLLRPKSLHHLIGWGMKFVRRRFKRVKFSEEAVWEWVGEFMVDFRKGFTIFIREKPQYLAWNMACYMCQYLMLFSVAFVVIVALGVIPNYLQVVGAQVPLFYVFSFIPSPGASGGVEISIASVFAGLIGPERLGMFVLLWRVITFYIQLVVGGAAFFIILNKFGNRSTK